MHICGLDRLMGSQEPNQNHQPGYYHLIFVLDKPNQSHQPGYYLLKFVMDKPNQTKPNQNHQPKDEIWPRMSENQNQQHYPQMKVLWNHLADVWDKVHVTVLWWLLCLKKTDRFIAESPNPLVSLPCRSVPPSSLSNLKGEVREALMEKKR